MFGQKQETIKTLGAVVVQLQKEIKRLTAANEKLMDRFMSSSLTEYKTLQLPEQNITIPSMPYDPRMDPDNAGMIMENLNET